MIGKLIRAACGANERHNRVLVEYVLGTREPGKSAYVGARGFVSDDLDGQLAEMTSLVRTARSDAKPIKHVMLSFREGEIPTPEQVEQVVDECVSVAGLSASHQVIFALHRDTQNAHIHVVLNAVDPTAERVTLVEYWHDVLAEVCVRLERKLGVSCEPGRRIELLADGTLLRRERRRAIAGPELDGEEHSGIASVKKMARRDRVSSLLKASRSWEEVHQRLAARGWTYEQKGSGSILRLHRLGLPDVTIKPSGIDTSLAFARMIRRLGPFRPAADHSVQPRDIEPARPELQPTELWAMYRAHRREVREVRNEASAELRRHDQVERAKLVDELGRQRPAMYGAFQDKRYEASIHAAVKAQQLEALRIGQAGERATLARLLREDLDYESWLERRVERDPADALATRALRAWQIRHSERMAWSPEPCGDVPAGIVDLRPLVEDGFVHYQRDGVTRFVDEGARLSLGLGSSDEDVLGFLRVSLAKWGSTFNLHGDDRFIVQCARVAAASRLPVRVLNHPEFEDLVAVTSHQAAVPDVSSGRNVWHRLPAPVKVPQASAVPTTAKIRRVDAPAGIPVPSATLVMAARWSVAQAWAIGKKGPSWSAEHDFCAAVAMRAAGATQDDVECTLFAMTPRFRVLGSPGGSYAARRAAAAAFGSFGDVAIASIDRDRELAGQLRDAMEKAIDAARLQTLRDAPGLRSAVPGEVVRGVVEHWDSRRVIVRAGEELIECFATIPSGYCRVGTWVDIQEDASSEPTLEPAP